MSKRKRSRPLYLQARRLIDPRSGEEINAWVARTDIDYAMMRSRGYKTGDVVRAEFRKPRSTGQHYRAHALGQLVAKHIEGFEGWDAHDVLKELQRDSGVCCDIHNLEVPGEGVLRLTKAQSLNYDEMDEVEFQEFFRGICRHICVKYWPNCNQGQIEAMIQIMPGEVA